MRMFSWHNSRGQIVTAPIVAEFTDRDGFVFYVVGPVKRGIFDTREPYEVFRKGDGGWRSDA